MFIFIPDSFYDVLNTNKTSIQAIVHLNKTEITIQNRNGVSVFISKIVNPRFQVPSVQIMYID